MFIKSLLKQWLLWLLALCSTDLTSQTPVEDTWDDKIRSPVGHPKNTAIKESPGFWVRSPNFQICQRLQEWFRFIEMDAPQPSSKEVQVSTRHQIPKSWNILSPPWEGSSHNLASHGPLYTSSTLTPRLIWPSLRYIKPISTSRPLHWLFLLLGMLFPQTFGCLPPSPLSFKLPMRPSWLHI